MKEAEKQRLIAVKEAEEARLAAEREKKEASASQNVSLTHQGKRNLRYPHHQNPQSWMNRPDGKQWCRPSCMNFGLSREVLNRG